MAVLPGLGGSNVTFRRPQSPARGHRSPGRRRLCTDRRVRPPLPGPWWGTV